ncbi:MAG TPA: heparan-alpha-glucosaminide N-acetyltransferase domain-containing protein [Vicinamibacterales bacterium]|nr:heparan-alpha-glucosaminide N-acetyltransferase domain-containing protein [Vicinamibacterales bacterium]
MRRKYVDWARAVAILLMVEAHTLDSWTRLSERGSHAFRYLTVLGGFAAPLFLWLAGLALVLSAERKAERTGSTRQAMSLVCRRGLEVFVLAFLFRIQAFIVSPGSPLITIFRVDILNVMGPAMAAAGVVWGATRGGKARAFAFSTLAVATAMVTPIVRASSRVSALPLWVQWYVRPMGDYTTFTLFPWIAFLFAGAAAGAIVSAARSAKQERQANVAFAIAGAALVVLGFVTAARPAIYAQTSFWTTSPTFFAIRLGLLMLTLPMLYAGELALSRRGIALERFEKVGRSSLFVYWIHVELVYGYATWPLRHHLTLWQVAIAYSLFTAALYAAILLRDRVVAAWRARRAAPSPMTAATA